MRGLAPRITSLVTEENRRGWPWQARPWRRKEWGWFWL